VSAITGSDEGCRSSSSGRFGPFKPLEVRVMPQARSAAVEAWKLWLAEYRVNL